MSTPTRPDHDKHRCFSSEMISHAVWLYVRCCRSDRDVEELMAERDVLLAYEATRHRQWCRYAPQGIITDHLKSDGAARRGSCRAWHIGSSAL